MMPWRRARGRRPIAGQTFLYVLLPSPALIAKAREAAGGEVFAGETSRQRLEPQLLASIEVVDQASAKCLLLQPRLTADSQQQQCSRKRKPAMPETETHACLLSTSRAQSAASDEPSKGDRGKLHRISTVSAPNLRRAAGC